MKRSIVIIILVFVFPGVWQSCIDDDSVGFVRELSMVNIESQDSVYYTDFGEEFVIEPTVSQTGEGGGIKYEWGCIGVRSNGNLKDSLKVISTEPVLHHAFRELGHFRIRLRATNEDGSSFAYYDVYVRTSFEQGLLVLSKDENNLGRTSFLRVKEPGEIVTGNDEKFILHAFEEVNPEIKLNDPQDITWGTYIMILAEGGKVIYRYDKMSFDFLNSFPVDEEIPGTRLKKFCATNPPAVGGVSYGWGVNGDTWIINYNMAMVVPDASFSPGEHFDKLYCHVSGNNVFFVNFEESYINHASGSMWPSPRFTSDKYFKEKNIVNLMGNEGDQLCVIATDLQDPQSVLITSYSNMNSAGGFPWAPQFYGGFLNPKDTTYRANGPLTLTRETEMLTNKAYRVTLYTRGNELYQWIYSGIKLPDTPLLTLDGEITCMTLSPDNNHLYLGIWNPSAREELKGSIYIMDMNTSKIVKEYRGIADKPMKIMYKN